jgi:hypothetical protein
VTEERVSRAEFEEMKATLAELERHTEARQEVQLAQELQEQLEGGEVAALARREGLRIDDAIIEQDLLNRLPYRKQVTGDKVKIPPRIRELDIKFDDEED